MEVCFPVHAGFNYVRCDSAVDFPTFRTRRCLDTVSSYKHACVSALRVFLIINSYSHHHSTTSSSNIAIMRYQQLLLSALAVLVFAKGEVAVRLNDPNAHDALPLDELRDIPVPTHTMATSAMEQDIPYATTAAIASVSSHVAKVPLSVFPAATDVLINAAGPSTNNADTKRTPDSINIKRTSNDDDTHHLHKRAACDPRPTLPNRYNVSLTNATTFRADRNIWAVANAANPTPTGYYQTFKNLQAATSAMNYLGFFNVNTTKGYDVDFCAAKCSAKAGCLAFNIYFDRNPTQTPGTACPNPPAFANIKCSLWGTAIDAKTATNKGSGNFKFVTAVAGSNGYVSYKLGGPIDGYDMQKLGNSVMNAPLYDCTHTLTYLGYKILQAGSVDPRLCAAACESQTKYNLAHPPAGARNSSVATCNAFGSYILSRTNKTKIVQLGQMCTFYTAYWDKKFAVNSASFDGKIKANYTYSFSSFYGKKGAQPSCNGTQSQFVSAQGTFVKGG
jgi:hypothetical protein